MIEEVEFTRAIFAKAHDASAVPVVLTGAFRPFEMQQSDALQNLTEALLATSLLEPGIYCASHGRALRFPGVRKDRVHSRFIREPADQQQPEIPG